MTILHQFTSRNPELLLRAAASGFLAPLQGTPEHPFPSPPCLLVLRQGGLRDDLIRLAARASPPVRGWFDPPLCVFSELPGRLGTTDRRACGEYERLVLVASLLRASANHLFAGLRAPTAYVAALDQLFGELAGEGVSAGQFQDALARLSDAEDAGTARRRDDFERTRDAGLLALYTSYLRQLEREGLRDGRDALVDCATALERDPAALTARLGGRREIRILGLGDLRRGWRRLLAALAASSALDTIGIYTSARLDLAPLDSVVTVLDGGDPHGGDPHGGDPHGGDPHGGDAHGVDPHGGDALADRLFVPGAVRGDTRVTLLATPDASREVEHIAVRVRALVDRGVPPHRIAIIARDARPYLDLALHALERMGVPATARRRIAYTDIPVVRAVLALLAAAADGFTRHGLAELAEQPYIGTGLNADVINHVGYQRPVRGLANWAGAFAALERDAAAADAAAGTGAARSTSRPRQPPPPPARVRAARGAFEQFAARAAALTAERPLDDWLGWLEALLADDPWQIEPRLYDVPDGEFRVARADVAGWGTLAALAAEWRAAARQWGEGGAPVGAEEFHAALRAMLAGDLAIHTGTVWGVQLLEASAAEYREFDHVFVAGCDAVCIPRRAPRSAILDDADRGALAAAGLPLELRVNWDAREGELLRMMVASARHRLTLSYANLDSAGYEVLRSTFIDAVADVAVLRVKQVGTAEVITRRMPLYRDLAAPARAQHAARIERVRGTGELSVYNGLIQRPALRARLASRYDEDYLWSPTQLESYAKCPWAHFSARLLGLDTRADPEADLDAAAEGAILHTTLQRFYDAACAHFGAPVMLRDAHREWARRTLPAELDATMDGVDHLPWIEHPALRALERAELMRTLERYIDFEIDKNEACFGSRGKRPCIVRTGVERHEVFLDAVSLQRGGVRIRYRGTVDRVERGMDERFPSEQFIAAVDYKRTASSTPGAGKSQAWSDGVVLQVPLYLHALQQMHAGDTPVRVEYRALRSPEIIHSLNLYSVAKGTTAPAQDAEAVAQLDAALDAAALHVRGARDGCFPAAPAGSCGCPPFCHAWDICRVKDGPKQLGWSR
ncbi:MAG: PD-(D/E)XK nuclease family protein [Gemmatimonadaceae bacterium]